MIFMQVDGDDLIEDDDFDEARSQSSDDGPFKMDFDPRIFRDFQSRWGL